MELHIAVRRYQIRSAFGLPMVSGVIVGSRGSLRVELVFDSGAANTQIHVGTLKAIGIIFDNRVPDVTVKGVTGDPEPGFTVSLERLHLLGKKYNAQTIAAFDFAEWADVGIDGLLGWDIIRTMHFEVDGPRSFIMVF